MSGLKESIHAKWMKGNENIIKDDFSLRQFNYDISEGKEPIGKGDKFRMYTSESLRLFRSGMGTITVLTRRLYGRYPKN